MTSSHIALSGLIWAPNLGEQKNHLDSTPSVPRNNLFVCLSFGLPYCTMHLQYFVSSFTAEKLVILVLFAPKSDLVSHSLSLSLSLVFSFLYFCIWHVQCKYLHVRILSTYKTMQLYVMCGRVHISSEMSMPLKSTFPCACAIEAVPSGASFSSMQMVEA